MNLSTASESLLRPHFTDTRRVTDLSETLSERILRESIPPGSATPMRLSSDMELEGVSSATGVGSVVPDPGSEELLAMVMEFAVPPGSEFWPIDGMRKWEGRVIEVDGDVFSAQLAPIGRDGSTWVSDFKTRLLEVENGGPKPGDMFYLTVRRVQRRGGDVTTSSIRARRLGKWTRRDLENIAERAQRRADILAENVE